MIWPSSGPVPSASQKEYTPSGENDLGVTAISGFGIQSGIGPAIAKDASRRTGRVFIGGVPLHGSKLCTDVNAPPGLKRSPRMANCPGEDVSSSDPLRPAVCGNCDGMDHTALPRIGSVI